MKLEKFLLKLFSLFVVKNQKYIVFESANDFYDNAYALCKYIKANYPQYKIKYLVTDKKMIPLAPSRGIEKKELLKASNKLKLYYYSLKAKAIFFSYNNYWKKLKLTEKTKLVFVTHGEFSLKNCKDYYDYICGPQENKVTFITRTEFTKKALQDKYPVLQNHDFLTFGMPRNDVMFNCSLNKEAILKSFGLKDYKNQDIILSMTTFRHENAPNLEYFKDEFPIKLNKEDLKELNSILIKNNQVLVIKLHHSQDGVIQPENLDNILFIRNNDILKNNTTINEFYALVSALITDFSNSFLGFLPLDRRIGFILADQEQYIKDRGFTLDNPEDFMPGEKMITKEDFFRFFNNQNKKDEYKELRAEVRSKLAGNYKDQNCKEISDYFLK